MEYMLLIYRSQELVDSTPPSERAEMMEGFGAFDRALEARGALRSTEALHPASAATTIRVRAGKTLTTDGPFAETKEQLGGYYVVEASDLDDAIQLASQIPIARFGSIEIRPIMKFD